MKKYFVIAVMMAVMAIALIGSTYAEESAAELNKAAVTSLRAGQLDKAIELFDKALKSAADPKDKTSALLGLSSSYLEKGIEPFAKSRNAAFYEKSLTYAMECLKVSPNQWQALGNIATVFMNTDDLEKADYYYKEAEKYADINSPFYDQMISQHKEVKEVLALRKKTGK